MGLVTSLLEEAAIKTDIVKIGDLPVTVQEVSVTDFTEYGKKAKEDRAEATAFLLTKCVLDEEGVASLSIDDARRITRSSRATLPIVKKIMELSGFRDEEEKKADAG